MRIALIYNGVIHNIFTADEIPDWPPYPDGTKPLLIDVTGKDAEENYPYDAETGTIISDPAEIQRHNYTLHALRIKDEQLEILRSEPYALKAESDPEFAERIRLSTEEWENIESREGFPFFPDDVGWPELWAVVPE